MENIFAPAMEKTGHEGMTYPSIKKLNQSNLMRTKHLLRNFSKYRALCPEGLEVQVSRAVLEILSFNLADREICTQSDFDLMDHCGSLLAPAIKGTVEEIRSFPFDVVSTIYPVLFHQYFDNDGPAIDPVQLRLRLIQEEIDLSVEEIQSYLLTGEQMMSTLLFPNKFVSAVRACS